jgi:hypothetical protein
MSENSKINGSTRPFYVASSWSACAMPNLKPSSNASFCESVILARRSGS